MEIMERGVYFDGWMKHNHCYHPSLPLRSLQMIEDLERYHATMLVWSAMGGGSISLPYLEQEIFGPVDPRMRFYGFMNDSEFVAECNRRGIKVFAIVFEVQGWEFPAVIDEESGEIKRLNLHAQQQEQHGWYGLREFGQDRYPNAFRTSLKDYYPNGIVNSDGEVVTDLWEECAARTYTGEPVHAKWVEVKNHLQQCYQTCRNNPVWRDYLKKIMALQIDGGVPGIQLDECELPMTAIGSGGCFCKDCMKQFTQYLRREKAAGRLSDAWKDIDLKTFNYRTYLNEHGCTFPENAPFYREYWEFQVRAVRKHFGELVDFAKDYAREKYGRELLVSGNFFNLQPAYYPIEPKVDVLITEMEHTLFRQPHFYRYCAGFAGTKPIVVAENPYGGIVPRLVELLDRGQGYDLYRIFLLEAAMYGCNMTVPYGGWMGNTIKDAFHPPRALTAQVQDFLYQHEVCYPKTPVKGAAVLYAFGSYYWREATKGGGGGNGMQDNFDDLMDPTTSEWYDPSVKHLPFWDIIREMSYAHAMYDVKMLPDGDLREDDMTEDWLRPYPMIVIPDCDVMTENQAGLILDYVRSGGKALIYGRLAENTDLAQQLRGMPGVVFVPASENVAEGMAAFNAAFQAMYAPLSCIECSDNRVGLQRLDADGCTYVHLMNYGYDPQADGVQPLPEVTLTLRGTEGDVRLYTLDGRLPAATWHRENDVLKITLRNVPVYTVVAVGMEEKGAKGEA